MIPHSQPDLGTAEKEAALEAISSGFLSQGARVEQLEQTVARDMQQKGAVATSTGTSALMLALLSLSDGQGGKVIIPSYACTSLLDAIYHAGCQPLVVDVTDEALVIDTNQAQQAIEENTVAVLLVHNFGNPANMEGLDGVEIPIIEDMAQCIGGQRDGRKTGMTGTCSILSFYATKLITTGYGGMIVSSRQALLDRARDLREFDNRESYEPRYHVSLSDLNAAIGVEQWKRLPEFIGRRRTLARRYDEVAGPCAVTPPGQSVYFRYLIRTPGRVEETVTVFHTRGVEAKRPVYRPLHRHLDLDPANFPIAEKAHNEIVSIPLYPALSEDQVQVILGAMEEVLWE